MQIWNWRNEAYSNKKLQKNTVVDKSLLDFDSERFCDTVLRENYKLKPKTHMKKTQSNNRGIYIHQNNEVREKFSPILFIRVGKIIQHQIKDMNASQNFESVSSLRRPETQIRHAQRHQRAGALTGSNIIIRNTKFTVYEVESQKTDNANIENGLIGFQ